ncbi:MAG: pilus assembly protein TadG-related protein [Pseudomonadota bacterium]
MGVSSTVEGRFDPDETALFPVQAAMRFGTARWVKRAPAGGRLGRFVVQEERGAITLLMVILFILMILATGTALDFAEHETERADLQSAVDRGVLAATSMRQTLPNDVDGDEGAIEDLVRKYVSTRSLSNKAVDVRIDETFTSTSREIDVAATYAMNTRFLNMIGRPTLDIAVRTSAVEKNEQVEISVVFDTSGSMKRNGLTGDDDPNKLDNFKVAAGKFVDQMLTGNDEKQTSMSLVQYDWHVNPGPWMYERIVGTAPAVGEQGSCYDILISDLTNFPGQVPGYNVPGARKQIIDARNVNKHDFEPRTIIEPVTWKNNDIEDICAPNSAATRYFEHDATSLMTTIGVKKDANGDVVIDPNVTGIEADGSTTTYFGLQWALALLNPATQPLIAEMTDPAVGMVDQAFANRPAAFVTGKTRKYVVLLTDGMMNIQADFYSPAAATEPTGVPSQNQVETAFKGLCDWAKHPTRDITIFTVSYDTTAQAESLMNYCASPGLAFRADKGNIDKVFDQIADTIERLRLVL